MAKGQWRRINYSTNGFLNPPNHPSNPIAKVKAPGALRSSLTASASSKGHCKATGFHPLNGRFLIKLFSSCTNDNQGGKIDESEEDEEEEIEEWEEEEEEAEPKMGDGGDGGGIVLRDVAWGDRVLSIAREILQQLGGNIELYAFKVSPNGYIYVRLDKLTHKYGCPSSEEIEDFSKAYKKLLDEVGEHGDIPDDLGLQVSSPGAERLLRVPDDLERFKDMPMYVSYMQENPETKMQELNEKVLQLDSVDIESKQCVWKLANVRENRDVHGKGRPLNKKQNDWRLTLSFDSVERVTMYLDYK